MSCFGVVCYNYSIADFCNVEYITSFMHFSGFRYGVVTFVIRCRLHLTGKLTNYDIELIYRFKNIIARGRLLQIISFTGVKRNKG